MHNLGRHGLGWHLLHNYGICLGVVHSYSLGELSPSMKERKKKTEKREKNKKKKERKKAKEKVFKKRE